MIENQEELRSVLEKNREQVKQIKVLKGEKGGAASEAGSQLEESQRTVRTANTRAGDSWFQLVITFQVVLSSFCWF